MASYDIPDPPPLPGSAPEAKALGYPEEALTAFLVIQDVNGRWQGISTTADGILPDLSMIKIDHEAALTDMVHGATAVANDGNNNLLINITGQTVVAMMHREAQAMQQKLSASQENKQVMDSIRRGGGLQKPTR